jgi:hypothetical protein
MILFLKFPYNFLFFQLIALFSLSDGISYVQNLRQNVLKRFKTSSTLQLILFIDLINISNFILDKICI